MTVITTSLPPRTLPVPRRAWLALLIGVTLLWLVTFEGGAVSEFVGGSGSFLHELFHDGRHLLGVPCH